MMLLLFNDVDFAYTTFDTKRVDFVCVGRLGSGRVVFSADLKSAFGTVRLFRRDENSSLHDPPTCVNLLVKMTF